MASKFKGSQRFRVIVGNVSFYTTAKQIRDGVGDLVQCNEAVRQSLASLEAYRVSCPAAFGQCGRWNDMNVQLNMA